MDAVKKQDKFAEKHSFDYPLLSDTSAAVAEAFGGNVACSAS